jgi:protoporphyrinogen IX oxidase
MLFQITKVIHLAAIISWMAGILYLYRILINMVDHKQEGANVHRVLFGMGERLYRFITMPAMGVTYIAGLALVAMDTSVFKGGYFHAKLLFVLFLTVSTVKAGKLLKASKENTDNLPSSKALRWMNEIPTVLMLIILVLIVIKPF